MPSERSLSLAQWQILRHLLGRPWAQQELAVALGRKSQAMAKSLGVLERRGMIRPVDERGHPGPSSPARRWTLTQLGAMFADGQPPSEGAPGAERPPRLPASPEDARDDELVSLHDGEFRLTRHQGYLTAAVRSNEVPALLEALASGEQAVESGFVARLDGDAHRYYFFFDPRLGARPTETLAAALLATGIEVGLGVIAEVRSIDDFVRDARAATAAARRAVRPRPEVAPE